MRKLILNPQLNIYYNSPMIVKLTKFVKSSFSSVENPMEQFFNSTAKELIMITQKGRSKYGSKIYVPHNPATRNTVVEFFNKY